jgi:magnesium transporter
MRAKIPDLVQEAVKLQLPNFLPHGGPMIRALYCTPDSPLDTGFPLEKFGSALQNPKGLLWVDFTGEPPAVCEPLMQDVFGFHPLAIDDALQETHTPKVDDWGSFVYILLNAMMSNNDPANGLLKTNEPDAFLGANYVVTHHDNPIAAMDEVWNACQRDARHLQSGADHLMYKIADHIVAGYMPIVAESDKGIDQIEDEIFDSPTPRTLEQIFSLKRALLDMRRVITPQREVLNKLARDDYPVIDPHDRVFFRDVYDHLVRLHDLNESMRDLVGGAVDTYLSVINNRMNEVMKTLTVITTLFMPISFVAGFFGMNFFEPVAHMTRWTDQPAFIVMFLITILLPISIYMWLRRRTWV